MVKVEALKNTHGTEGFLEKGQVYNVSLSYYVKAVDERLQQGKKPLVKKVEEPSRKTKEEKAPYNTKESKSYEQKGSWFTVYQDGEEIDKFQGKDGLKKHGIEI